MTFGVVTVNLFAHFGVWRLSNNNMRISMALHLVDMCHKHTCVCGELEVNLGVSNTHPYCKKAKGKYARHRDVKNIIHKTWNPANISAQAELDGLL